MKLKTEIWRSDNNQEEIHLFVPNERNEYLLGFNPTYISPDTVKKFLEPLCFEFDP